MSTSPDTPKAPSNAGRYLFVLIFGLALGTIGTVMLLNTLNARKDHFPESVMYVQQHHLGQLKSRIDENRCNANDVLPHLKALRVMADDLERAFPDEAADTRYAKHASSMRATLDGVLGAPPVNCEGVRAATSKIGEGCKACHQDFRS